MKQYYFCIVILLFIILLFIFFPFREGFGSFDSIGEYSYLEPVAKGNTWDDNTKQQFIVAMNKNITKYYPNQPQGTMDSMTSYFNSIIPECTSEEAQYYINNGNYPFCTYITDYINKNSQDPATVIQHFSMSLPNRFAYGWLISQTESKESPQPLSLQIFMGTAEPPPPTISQEIETTIGNIENAL
jgi:hypothetical protein